MHGRTGRQPMKPVTIRTDPIPKRGISVGRFAGRNADQKFKNTNRAGQFGQGRNRLFWPDPHFEISETHFGQRITHRSVRIRFRGFDPRGGISCNTAFHPMSTMINIAYGHLIFGTSQHISLSSSDWFIQHLRKLLLHTCEGFLDYFIFSIDFLQQILTSIDQGLYGVVWLHFDLKKLCLGRPHSLTHELRIFGLVDQNWPQVGLLTLTAEHWFSLTGFLSLSWAEFDLLKRPSSLLVWSNWLEAVWLHFDHYWLD